jgi:ribonuclease P protein component
LLARENRLLSPLDFRDISRSRNRRLNQAFILNWRESSLPAHRFGFVVSRAVGSAVKRNLAKRRLREASRSWLAQAEGTARYDFVFRAKPEILQLSFAELEGACHQALTEATG